MKKFIFILLILFLSSQQLDACIGRIINISVLGTSNEKMLAELVSIMINERTGTTVNIKVYKNLEELYEAVKRGEFSILIENTDRAMLILDRPAEEDKKKAYAILKEEYRNNLNLTWLKPFGFLSGDSEHEEIYYSPVVSKDVLINFPALPRVLNKLYNISSDRNFNKFVDSVKSGEKIKRVARDFLKKKKLI